MVEPTTWELVPSPAMVSFFGFFVLISLLLSNKESIPNSGTGDAKKLFLLTIILSAVFWFTIVGHIVTGVHTAILQKDIGFIFFVLAWIFSAYPLSLAMSIGQEAITNLERRDQIL